MALAQASVGIIANPASGRDIRRLVAHATTVDNQGKVGIIRRALVGLGALGVTQVYAMPDSNRLVEQAAEDLVRVDPWLQVRLLDMAVTHRPEDSRLAAERMRELDVGCIIVLGGDGTVRMVAQGAGETPLLPISTGTNNVLPKHIEGTIAGMAAAAVSRRLVGGNLAVFPHKQLDIAVGGGYHGMALVDVALTRDRFVGAKAIWRVPDLLSIAVTRASVTSIGITSIAAMVEPVATDAPYGLALDLGTPRERRVFAALAPGLIEPVDIRSAAQLEPGQTIHWNVTELSVLAMDGEREVTLQAGDRVEIALSLEGPRIVDVKQVMGALVDQRMLEL